jgi:hypothetical protein
MTNSRKTFHGAPTAAWLAFVLLCCCAVARANDVTWEFGPQVAPDARWTVERGRVNWDQTPVRLQPDRGGRVVLLSPDALKLTSASIKSVSLEVSATGLQRVRLQGRRDARGGWITLVDVPGTSFRKVDNAIVIDKTKRVPDGPIEKLRVELTYRTTTARELSRISVLTQ